MNVGPGGVFRTGGEARPRGGFCDGVDLACGVDGLAGDLGKATEDDAERERERDFRCWAFGFLCFFTSAA